MQIHVQEEISRRIGTERELTEERITLQQDLENLEIEREIYQQRIRDSEQTVSESQHRLPKLQETLGDEQKQDLDLKRNYVKKGRPALS